MKLVDFYDSKFDLGALSIADLSLQSSSDSQDYAEFKRAIKFSLFFQPAFSVCWFLGVVALENRQSCVMPITFIICYNILVSMMTTAEWLTKWKSRFRLRSITWIMEYTFMYNFLIFWYYFYCISLSLSILSFISCSIVCPVTHAELVYSISFALYQSSDNTTIDERWWFEQ